MILNKFFLGSMDTISRLGKDLGVEMHRVVVI